MEQIYFQQKAIEQLLDVFENLWNASICNQSKKLPLVFKSPTGSGKTYMVTKFLQELQNSPTLDADMAFVWITFSDDLAMQSRDKFMRYFSPDVGRNLLTVADINNGILQKDDILFLNWQKVATAKVEMRKLRRPGDENLQKESGFYFEDVSEATHNVGREIVLIIDESHKNQTKLSEEIIDIIAPRIILKVSATPEKEPSASDVQNWRAGFVEVNRQDVVAQGLIKEAVYTQTEDELESAPSDLDELLLSLAMQKQKEVRDAWAKIGTDINPLVLIQLPSDDNDLKSKGIPTKEEVVLKFLKDKCGVPDHKIALWFDKNKKNLDRIDDNNSPVDFLLFKVAAATGWDCPRAHIIVMFREIGSSTFKTQVLGRILRNPVPKLDLKNSPILRTGYLYTNYRKNEITDIRDTVENKPKTEISELEQKIKIELATKQFRNDLAETLANAVSENSSLGSLKENDCSHNYLDNASEKISAAPTPIEKIAVNVFEEIQKIDLENIATKQVAISEEFNFNNSTSEISKVENLKEKVVSIVETHIKDVAQNSSEVQKLIMEVTPIVEDFARIVCTKSEAAIIVDPLLKSDFISRADYGDLGKSSDFQTSFVNSMNKYFGIEQKDFNGIKKLQEKGIDTSPTLKREIIIDGKIEDGETIMGSNEIKMEVSENDAEKMFATFCYNLLDEQTESDAKYGNLKRSWGPLKLAFYKWFDDVFVSYDKPMSCKVVVKDLQKEGASVLRPAITQALKEYRHIRDAFVAKRKIEEEKREALPFAIKTTYAYTDEYKIYKDVNKSMVKPFRLKESYKGRDNEIAFIKFLEQWDAVGSWFKQADSGKDFYAIRYVDSQESTPENKVERLFYPDWIIKFADGRIGIFDTKGGITAKSTETKDKAEALSKRIKELNVAAGKEKFLGGIVVKENAQWYYNDKEIYEYKSSLNGWKLMMG